MKMSSSQESSDSDSSQFSFVAPGSDDDKRCVLNKSDSDSDAALKSDPVPGFSEEEKKEIFETFKTVKTLSGSEDLPSRVIPKRHETLSISSKLELLDRSLSLVFVSVKDQLHLTRVRHRPASVVGDACVFSEDRPLMVLTFASSRDRKTELYNSRLAREIMAKLNKEMKCYMTCTHGVLSTNDLATEESFKDTVSHLQRDHFMFAVPISLQMTSERCARMLELLLDMMEGSNNGTTDELDESDAVVFLTEEKYSILRFPDICQGPTRVLPGKVWENLRQDFPELCLNVEEILGKTHKLIIVNQPKSDLFKCEDHQGDIDGIRFDIFAFSSSNPMMVLTFAERRTREVVDHNTQIAKFVNNAVNREILVFSCVHTVFTNSDSETREDLDTRLYEIRKCRFHDEHNLTMFPRKCHHVVTAFLKLLPNFDINLDVSSEEIQRLSRRKDSWQPKSMWNVDVIDPKQEISQKLDCLPSEIHLVMVGNEGVGKTTVANTILGKEIFTCATCTLDLKKEKVHGRLVYLRTTPDDWLDFTPVLTGVHAVVVVLSVTDIDERDWQMVQNLKKSGEDVINHVIVVLTGLEKLMNEYDSIIEFLRSNPKTDALLNEFGNQYVMFNNTGSEDGLNFMTSLSDLIRMNKGKLFTQPIFQE